MSGMGQVPLSFRMLTEGVLPKEAVNNLVEALENLLVFNDSDTIRWEVSPSQGLQAFVIKEEDGGGGGGGIPCNNLLPTISGGLVSVSPGFIDNAVPTLGGTSLDDSTPPTATATIGHTVYMVVDITPTTEDTTAPYMIDGMTIANHRIEVSGTDPASAASIDETTGSITAGVDSHSIGTIVDDGEGNPKIGTSRCGHWQTLHCDGEGTIKWLPEGF